MPALIILLSANLSSAHCNLPLPALDSHVTSKMGKRPDFFGAKTEDSSPRMLI